MKIVAPKTYMNARALNRNVMLVDRGVAVRRVIPVAVLVAMDEAHLARDAHLTYGVQHETGPMAVVEREIQRGFVARACAYAATIMSPSQQAFLYEHVMPLDQIVKDSRLPLTQFEIDRAELFDHIQGGNRAKMLGKMPPMEPEVHPHLDHA